MFFSQQSKIIVQSIYCLSYQPYYRRLPRERCEGNGDETPPFGLPTPHTSSKQMNEDETTTQTTPTTANANPPEMSATNQPTISLKLQTWAPPTYDAINRQILLKTKSGNLHCINLPRPPEPRSEDFVSCANRNWTTN